MPQENKSSDESSLRRSAEEKLEKNPKNAPLPADEDIQEIVHELEVHEAELEIQNEELRRSQEELTDSRNLYEELYDFAPVGYLTLDREGRILDANLAAAKMFGVERSKLKDNAKFSSFVSPESQDIWHKYRIEVLECQEKKTCELDIVNADRSTLNVRLETVCLTSPEEDRPRLLTTIIDITNIKKADEALKENQALLVAVIENATDPIYVKDRQSRILICNPALEKVAGKPAAEIIGKTDSVYYDDPVIGKALHENDMLVMESGRSQVMEETVKTPNGVRTFLSNKSPYRNESGEIIGIIGISHDVTERKRMEDTLRDSEARFRVAQELSLDAFTILESVRDELGAIVDFRWIFVNPEAGRILKYPPEELLGKRLLEVLPGNKTESNLFDNFVRVVDTGKSHDYELYYKSDGIDGWFRYMIVKLGDGIAVDFSDITERKWGEKNLLALNEDMSRFNRVAVGRELRMIELKQEVNTLLKQAGLPLRYLEDLNDLMKDSSNPGNS